MSHAEHGMTAFAPGGPMLRGSLVGICPLWANPQGKSPAAPQRASAPYRRATQVFANPLSLLSATTLRPAMSAAVRLSGAGTRIATRERRATHPTRGPPPITTTRRLCPRRMRILRRAVIATLIATLGSSHIALASGGTTTGADLGLSGHASTGNPQAG